MFFEACGCAFGLTEDRGYTRSQAWREFFDTAHERNTAMDRGVTGVLVDHDRYVAEFMPMLLSGYTCPHTAVTT